MWANWAINNLTSQTAKVTFDQGWDNQVSWKYVYLVADNSSLIHYHAKINSTMTYDWNVLFKCLHGFQFLGVGSIWLEVSRNGSDYTFLKSWYVPIQQPRYDDSYLLTGSASYNLVAGSDYVFRIRTVSFGYGEILYAPERTTTEGYISLNFHGSVVPIPGVLELLLLD